MNIRLFKPNVGEEELNAIREVFGRQWLGLGPKVTEFENEWAKYLNVKMAIGVNSATAALHLALASFKFPKGKKVLVPSLTFAATAEAVLYNDLVPVFVDINEETLGIDLLDAESKMTKDCVAIMMVHMAGHALPMDEMMSFAKKHNLKVVEDCAHCPGGEYKGKKLGTIGDVGCYSFEEKKGMTTGDGGMIVSNNVELISPLKAMRWFGIDKDTWKRESAIADKIKDSMHWFYSIKEIGFKYNMNDIAAAMGLCQLSKLDRFNREKRDSIELYLNYLSKSDLVKPVLPYDLKINSSYWIFVVRVHADLRDRLIIHLKENGVATSVHYTPLTQQPLFAPFHVDCPVSDKVYNEMITLPLYSGMKKEEVKYVCDSILNFKP